MADHEQDPDDDLFADLYEADDTADSGPEPVPAEPEVPAADDFQQPEPEQPVIAAGSTAGAGNDNGMNQQDDGMGGMDGMGGYDSPPEERHIGMKEDG